MRKLQGAILTASVVAFFLSAAGCDSDGPELGEVSGTVTWLGRPANAEIVFKAMQTDDEFGGRPSTGNTDERGQYTLTWSPERAGALLGQHNVIVKVFQHHDPDVQLKFGEATTPVAIVEMQRFVGPGENSFDFHLRP